MWPSKTKAPLTAMWPSKRKTPVNRHVVIEEESAVNGHATIEEGSSVCISGSIANEAIEQLGLKEGGKAGACSASSCPARRNGRGPSSAERRQDLRPMHDSGGLDTKRPSPRQDLRAMYPKSPDCTPKRMHRTKILPSSARKACISRERCQEGGIFVQSARRGYMRHDSCHISQNNLKDRHSEAMGRRSIGPKEDPRAAAKSPSAKATPTRPLSLTTRSNTQISLRPRQPPREHRSSRLKQRKNQLSTKDPLRKAACAKPLDAHRCRHRRP